MRKNSKRRKPGRRAFFDVHRPKRNAEGGKALDLSELDRTIKEMLGRRDEHQAYRNKSDHKEDSK